MAKINKLLFLLCIIPIFQSCFTTHYTPQKTDEQIISEQRDSWMGVSEQNLYAHQNWGIPDKTGTDGAGGKIATYYRSKSYYSSYTGYISATWVTSFYIDKEGKIYNMTARRE